jgi:serine/threonine protein phosphatase PrpC
MRGVGHRKPSSRALSAPPTRSHGVGVTDIGMKRLMNQDAFLVDDALGLYVVADGMGGVPAGDVASREAVDAVFGMVRQGRCQLSQLHAPLIEDHARAACRLLEAAVQGATYQVFAMGAVEPRQTGMGTTLSALMPLGGYAVMAHVGDSRIYRVRHGNVQVITDDHTVIAWQLKEGIITPQQAKTSSSRGAITRAVGLEEHVEVDTGLVTLEPGDRFLLCTDGLHIYLRDEDITFCMVLSADLAAQHLVEIAKERGGSDNITAVIVECDAGVPPIHNEAP